MKAQDRIALPAALSLVALLIVLARFTLGADSNPKAGTDAAAALPPPSNGAISPQNQADALHFVIAADREICCRMVAALEAGRAPDPSAGGRPGESWPSPCAMLRRAAESIQGKGAEFSYALRSLDPLNPRNGPQTELEQTGLAFVASHPGQNYYGPEMLGGRRYVTAVYPDLPAVTACLDCHNRRSTAGSRRHQVGEVMGGVVVRVPLEF